jgi:trk system potassium uptake protein TrkH
LFDSLGEAIRHVSFTVASIISTTGFATVDFDVWPEFSKNCIILLMFIGACAGSTGGGLKISRLLILIKGMGKELRNLIHPRQVRKITIDSRPIEHEVVRSTNVYMITYLLIFVVSMIAISFDNHDFITNFSAVTATINNVGPGFEMVGPTQNFAFFSSPAKIVLSLTMLAGRLELFPMLLLFSPSTWRK